MYNLTNQTIIDVKVGSIIKKHNYDKVVLVGTYLYKDSSYVENVDIVVHEEDGSVITTKIPYSGYGLELFLGDFNGDGKDEIMVRGEYGGSGGYAIAAIYDYRDEKLVEIFNPDMFSEKYVITANYLDGYKVLVESVTLKEKYIFDISQSPTIYLNMVYEENKKVKEKEVPTVSAINGAFPIKLVFEKNYYLFLRQRVIGVNNADTIGYIESFVNLLNNDIKVVDMGAYMKGQKKILDRSINKEFKDVFPLGTNFISIKELGRNKDKIEIDLDFDGSNEYLIPYKLDGIPYLGVLRVENDDYVLIDTFKGDGYNIKDLVLKKIGKKYYIFVGFELGGSVRKLEILTYKNGRLVRKFKDNVYYYTKMYIKDLDNDGKEELILWLHDTGEAYTIDIYSIKEYEIKKSNKYDKIYFKEVIKHYKNLLETYKNSSTYLYYLALAYEKVGEFEGALITIEEALNTEHPYPSIRELKKYKGKAYEIYEITSIAPFQLQLNKLNIFRIIGIQRGWLTFYCETAP